MQGIQRTMGALLVARALSGCAGTIALQRPQTAGLTKGTSASEAERLIDKASVLLSHDFETGGKRYTARHYVLQTGTRQDMMVVCTPTCMSIPVTVPVTAPYVVVYEADAKTLVAWGTVEELSRSPDEATAALMPALKAAQAQAQAKKG